MVFVPLHPLTSPTQQPSDAAVTSLSGNPDITGQRIGGAEGKEKNTEKFKFFLPLFLIFNFVFLFLILKQYLAIIRTQHSLM